MIGKRPKSPPGVRVLGRSSMFDRINGMMSKRNIAVVITCIILIMAMVLCLDTHEGGGDDSVVISAFANGSDTDNVTVSIDLNVDYARGNGDQKPRININVMGEATD